VLETIVGLFFALVAGVVQNQTGAVLPGAQVTLDVNYSYYVGNLSSSFFGRAILAQAPRQFPARVRD